MSPRIFLLPALLLSAAPGVKAQTATATTTTAAAAPVIVKTRNAVGDRIIMHAGGLVEINGSQGTRIDLDTILPGGIRVTPGGTVYMADGTTASLQDGQMITVGGKIRPATADEISIANSSLDSGTAGVGQGIRDQAAEARDAAAAAQSAPNPNTNDRTTGMGNVRPMNGIQADSRISPNTAVNAEGPTQGAPPAPTPNPATATDIRRDQLRANRQLPSQQQ